MMISNKVVKRRFAIYPMTKNLEEETALQQIQLREEHCLGIVLYPKDSAIAQGKYYYYVNPLGVECLFCEVSVIPEKCGVLSSDFINELAVEALQIEEQNKIIMEGIRTQYHAEDYIRESSRSMVCWLSSISK